MLQYEIINGAGCYCSAEGRMVVFVLSVGEDK